MESADARRWDDIWRRNHLTVSAIEHNDAAFNPNYSTSICYRPMARHDLEQFLASFDLWSATQRRIFSPGFLNRVYFTCVADPNA